MRCFEQTLSKLEGSIDPAQNTVTNRQFEPFRRTGNERILIRLDEMTRSGNVMLDLIQAMPVSPVRIGRPNGLPLHSPVDRSPRELFELQSQPQLNTPFQVSASSNRETGFDFTKDSYSNCRAWNSEPKRMLVRNQNA